MNNKIAYLIGLLVGLFTLGLILIFFLNREGPSAVVSVLPQPVFAIRSVDTMKMSRDLARAKVNDEIFDATIEWQVKAIADLGATHLAIGTPYDEEFIPYLTRWIRAARQYGLKVWFRGNFAGWEQWFDYPQISRDEHKDRLNLLIRNHPDLFVGGDIFTPCPECENGGPGDPRTTGDLDGFRSFLIDERALALTAFRSLNKNVSVDIQSMNYDVAKLVMDPGTTQKLGGVVGIDHYVRDPHQLKKDVLAIAESSGGKIILSEYGAPIPDLHDDLDETTQAEWLRLSLEDLSGFEPLIGLNYWVNVGGSTALWHEDGRPKTAVAVLSEYFHLWK